MTKKFINIICLTILITSCKGEKKFEPPVGETDKIEISISVDNSTIDLTSVMVTGSTNKINYNVSSYGFYWDTLNSNNNAQNHIDFNNNNYTNFSQLLSNLSINKKYFVLSYIKFENTLTIYSDTAYFSTLSCPGVVIETIAPYSITQTMALAGGNIICISDDTLKQRGICWSTADNPDVETDNFSTNGKTTGSFTGLANNLTPGTSYYLRAYAKTNVKTYYGETYDFKTLE